MQANPTSKPYLPKVDQIMEEFNISFPIQTSQQLTETVKLLRAHYYFIQLPEEWIEIQTGTPRPQEDAEDTPWPAAPLPSLPDTLVEVNTLLASQGIELSLPITAQQDVTPTMKILRDHFKIKSIPDFLLDLPPLPTPSWDIFGTNTQSRPSSPSTIRSTEAQHNTIDSSNTIQPLAEPELMDTNEN